MQIGVLMERRLEADNLDATIQIELLSAVEVQVNVREYDTVTWCRNTMDGELALDMYHHPWYYGYKGGGRNAAVHGDREHARVSA